MLQRREEERSSSGERECGKEEEPPGRDITKSERRTPLLRLSS